MIKLNMFDKQFLIIIFYINKFMENNQKKVKNQYLKKR